MPLVEIVKNNISPEQVEAFNSLAERWRAETAHLSSIHAKMEHPSYQQIINMGEAAIPLILESLEKELNHWFPALVLITHEDPVKTYDSMDGAREIWLQWGKEKDILK